MQYPSSKADWKLRQFYYVTQISGLVVIFLILGALLYIPSAFVFMGDPQVVFLLCLCIFIFHALLFYFQEHFQKKIYYTLSRYVWVAFFLSLVYISGGIHSSLVFLLMFPLLASVVDLDARATKVVGLISTIVFGSFIFFDATSALTYEVWTEHIFNTVILGTIAYYAYQIVDNTLRQKYERDEAQRKLNEMVEVDQLKTDFLTVASHQLRNPLTASRWGFEEVLTHKDLPKDVSETLTTSFSRIEEAIGIVNEMLKTAELGAQGLKLKLEKIDFVALVKSVVQELGHLSISSGVPVQFQTTTDHLMVSADRKLLLPALMNIVDNAIRYSPKGKVFVSVSRDQSGDAVLTVTDSGIGIPEAAQQYVFQRLYRAPNAIAVDPNESGVGLYSTKKIVELHNGKITFMSSIGKGTTFTVTLPTVS
ncbi:MAG: HAMP domain-containing sensor histidine kinase [Patescibacteria group bacterium]